MGLKKAIVIPARFASTRLPGKPLVDIGGKPLIQWVYEKARASRHADSIIIATDDERIRETCREFGALVVMTDPDLPSGTDRVHQAINGIDADLVVNLQGDEPFIEPAMVDVLFEALEQEGTPMATLCTVIANEREYTDPNTVKVVFDINGFALYFSRSPIPYVRNPGKVGCYKHIGIYGFRRSFLNQFIELDRSSLEETESLEQLRVLENGFSIRVLVTGYTGFGIDTEKDLEKARERLAAPVEQRRNNENSRG